MQDKTGIGHFKRLWEFGIGSKAVLQNLLLALEASELVLLPLGLQLAEVALQPSLLV